MTPALRAYLSWQAELGTEEVILPAPLRPRPDAAVSAAAAAPAVKNLFEALAASLESPAAEKKPLPAAATAPIRTEAHFPVFSSLEDYWTWMEGNQAALHGAAAAPLIRSSGPRHAPLAVLGLEPGTADAAEAHPFTGEAGELLDKMLRAIHLERESLYCACLVKMAMPGKVWNRRELARLAPLLQIEMDLAQPALILILGEACAQALLKTGKPLDELRPLSHTLGGRECRVTYHPQDLLRNEELKRKAWEDLKRLRSRLPGGAGA